MQFTDPRMLLIPRGKRRHDVTNDFFVAILETLRSGVLEGLYAKSAQLGTVLDADAIPEKSALQIFHCADEITRAGRSEMDPA